MTATYFYYRNGCHLCEEMAAVLHRDWPLVAESMQWRDVDADPQWRTSFGERVPVLARGDMLICEYFLDPSRMQACFGDQTDPL